MRASCGMTECACKHFYWIKLPDFLLCNSMINAYVKIGLWGGAIFLFDEMREDGVELDCDGWSYLCRFAICLFEDS